MNLNASKNLYSNLLNTLDHGKKAVMITILNHNDQKNNPSRNITLLTEENLHVNNSIKQEDSLYKNIKYAVETGNLQFIIDPDKGTILIEPYFPESQLIVLGGGHIAKPLVEFASRVGFCVTVVDDRPSFANKGRFPDAKKVICESFENCFSVMNLNSSSFIVIITRGHRHDMYCLKQTLKYDTAYVGMIGSKRRTKIVKEQLLDEGYSLEQLNNVNAPIGLDIDAVSPEEIAVSILAQLISYKRSRKSVSGALLPHKANCPEFDRFVIEELAKELNEPKAIATIVSTKGSVPRKAGAKMIVYPDGRTLGSIGGGCSEGEVINTARNIIKSGGYQIQEVDMTGYIAEEEGMVCGGIMEVLIESVSS